MPLLKARSADVLVQLYDDPVRSAGIEAAHQEYLAEMNWLEESDIRHVDEEDVLAEDDAAVTTHEAVADATAVSTDASRQRGFCNLPAMPDTMVEQCFTNLDRDFFWSVHDQNRLAVWDSSQRWVVTRAQLDRYYPGVFAQLDAYVATRQKESIVLGQRLAGTQAFAGMQMLAPVIKYRMQRALEILFPGLIHVDIVSTYGLVSRYDIVLKDAQTVGLIFPITELTRHWDADKRWVSADSLLTISVDRTAFETHYPNALARMDVAVALALNMQEAFLNALREQPNREGHNTAVLPDGFAAM